MKIYSSVIEVVQQDHSQFSICRETFPHTRFVKVQDTHLGRWCQVIKSCDMQVKFSCLGELPKAGAYAKQTITSSRATNFQLFFTENKYQSVHQFCFLFFHLSGIMRMMFCEAGVVTSIVSN